MLGFVVSEVLTIYRVSEVSDLKNIHSMTAEAQRKRNMSWFASWPPPDGISRYAGSYPENLTFLADINCSLNQQGEAQLRGIELLVYWSKSEAKLKCI